MLISKRSTVPLQYRIWAELIDGDLASSTKPPENSMFTRAGQGGGTTQKKSEVAEAQSLSKFLAPLRHQVIKVHVIVALKIAPNAKRA